MLTRRIGDRILAKKTISEIKKRTLRRIQDAINYNKIKYIKE